ncbi:MAG TPA: choice-of-anchor L domain-containing protein [Bacteroidia bacterium]|nr:choice-of-anchor L domain-containing protein [Bacteroidia bacterium]
MKIKHLLAVFSICLISFTGTIQAQPIVVTNSQTAFQLTYNLIGQGIVFSNASGQFTPLSAASFTNPGVTGFSMPSGIMLSSGELDEVNSPQSFHNSTDIGLLGDPLLDAIVYPRLTEDASILEFDFRCAGDSVEFEFIFNSEEYNDYANTNFIDIFAFFVSGPGYSPNTNVAFLPGTSTPITINTVNNGNSGGTATGPCMNCAYFVDNVNTGAVAMSQDGYTIPIKIKFPVWPCSDYHFKIAIADAGDGVFDSQVIMKGSSFQACPLMQIVQNGMPLSGTQYICAGGSLTLSAPTGPSYNWSTGDTTQTIVVTQPGNYQFFISDSNCYAYSENITVVLAGNIQTPVISQSGTALISTVVPAPGITYQWNLNGVPIPGATQSTLQIPGNGCYTLTIYEGTCESTSNTECITNTSLYELSQNDFHIFPHPVTGSSVIETPFIDGSVSTLELLDMTGRKISEQINTESKSFTFEKGEIPSGVYIIKLSNSLYQGNIFKKIIIN